MSHLSGVCADTPRWLVSREAARGAPRREERDRIFRIPPSSRSCSGWTNTKGALVDGQSRTPVKSLMFPGETWLGMILFHLPVVPAASPVAHLSRSCSRCTVVCAKQNGLPNLTIEQILKWADKHKKRTDGWPSKKSGNLIDAAGETWRESNQHSTMVTADFPAARVLLNCLRNTAACATKWIFRISVSDRS